MCVCVCVCVCVYSCEDGCLVGLERELRALLLKISVSDALLQSNPPGWVLCPLHVCTYTVSSFVYAKLATRLEKWSVFSTSSIVWEYVYMYNYTLLCLVWLKFCVLDLQAHVLSAANSQYSTMHAGSSRLQ